MKANVIHRFGPPDVIMFEETKLPHPGHGEVLVRVMASGVGPWDGWIREGKSVLPQPLPLTLGSDLSGIVEQVGEGVDDVKVGDEVFGVTNPRFTGANAEYALASVGMIAAKPNDITHIEAASIPVVAVTAWQMLFDHGGIKPNQKVLVLGAAGNVGSYAVQLAHGAGAHVFASAADDKADYVRRLGATRVFDGRAQDFPAEVKDIDLVVDAVGGEAQTQALASMTSGGVFISAVSQPDQDMAKQLGVKAAFMLVDVTSSALKSITKLLDAKALRINVGTVLRLAELRRAHEMLEGVRAHKGGKIVLEGS